MAAVDAAADNAPHRPDEPADAAIDLASHDVAADFSMRVGRDPDAVGSAPGRVNLIGEHLDYNGGSSLPLPLTARTYAALAPRDDGRLVMRSVQQDEPVTVEVDALDAGVGGWAGYVAGVVWALDAGADGYDILVDGRVPLGAGLSSSAALECAVAVALDNLAGGSASLEDLVAACVRAENDYVGANTGSMDQTVALRSRPGHALLIDFASGELRPVPWQPPGELLVVDTRAAHALIGGEYAERRAACEDAAATLGVPHLSAARPADLDRLSDPVQRRRARHVVTETQRVAAAVAAMERGDWPEVGRLMSASHESLRDDYEVSCTELDVAVEAALEAGASGARMTGGGFGGSAIALVPPGGGEAVRDAVESAYASAGLRPPEFVAGRCGEPAAVVRLRRR